MMPPCRNCTKMSNVPVNYIVESTQKRDLDYSRYFCLGTVNSSSRLALGLLQALLFMTVQSLISLVVRVWVRKSSAAQPHIHQKCKS